MPDPEAARFGEEDLLPISALQHLLFCERQCALIHVEGLWAENRLTVEGRRLHDKAHSGRGDTVEGVRTTRGLSLRSLRLGLVGKADVVEFRERSDGAPVPFPVEYKRGRPKKGDADKVQLCAQALCLEEMLGTTVPGGALFYGVTRRRLDVLFDHRLRATTESTASRLHQLIGAQRTPPAVREPKCDSCSLLNLCMPGAMSAHRSASVYVADAITETLAASADAEP